jgi:hypothetical protein
MCPFIDAKCTKTLKDGTRAGVCSLKQSTQKPVVCCPNRLYGDDWLVLRDVAEIAFGPGHELVAGAASMATARRNESNVVGVFGKSWGGELHLPQRGGSGSYFVDYILALVSPDGLIEFVAVEVQSIDTTGNYHAGLTALRSGRKANSENTAGFNWENVSKRILPQVIYKSNVLQQEDKCVGGLFFITPKPVYEKILGRLLGANRDLPKYPLSASAITFLSYDPDWEAKADAAPVPLRRTNKLTTSAFHVAQAFIGVSNLPPAGSYEAAIVSALA